MSGARPATRKGWGAGKGGTDPSRDRFRFNLARLMSERGITQASLARTMDVSRVAVHAWIWGTCFPETSRVIRLAQALGVPVGALLEDASAAGPPEAADAPPDHASEEEAMLLAVFRKLPAAGRTALLAEAYELSGRAGLAAPRAAARIANGAEVV
jgi:transcriptional regulator with XRE-family HTH domain